MRKLTFNPLIPLGFQYEDDGIETDELFSTISTDSTVPPGRYKLNVSSGSINITLSGATIGSFWIFVDSQHTLVPNFVQINYPSGQFTNEVGTYVSSLTLNRRGGYYVVFMSATNTFDVVRLNPYRNYVEQIGTYPNTTFLQNIYESIFYYGKDYPVAKRQTDVWLKKVTTPVFDSFTGVTTNSFTVNYLAGTFINQDGTSESQLANRYRLELSTSPSMTSPTVATSTSLFYTFTGLTQPTYYVRFRAELFTQQGMYEYSDWSAVQSVNLNSDPILALNPLYYLDGSNLNDRGTAGGTWLTSGTVTIDTNGYNFNSASNAYLYRQLATTFDIGSSNTTPFVLVFWATLGNTSSTTRDIVTLIETLLSTSVPALKLGGNGDTTGIRIERTNPSSTGGSQAIRDNTMKKIVLEWRSGSYSFIVNNGTPVTLSRPTSPFNVNWLVFGAQVNNTNALGFPNNPIIKKIAFWIGTVPTTGQIDSLPLTV